jgi:hypothetical protein
VEEEGLQAVVQFLPLIYADLKDAARRPVGW